MKTEFIFEQNVDESMIFSIFSDFDFFSDFNDVNDSEIEITLSKQLIEIVNFIDVFDDAIEKKLKL